MHQLADPGVQPGSALVYLPEDIEPIGRLPQRALDRGKLPGCVCGKLALRGRRVSQPREPGIEASNPVGNLPVLGVEGAYLPLQIGDPIGALLRLAAGALALGEGAFALLVDQCPLLGEPADPRLMLADRAGQVARLPFEIGPGGLAGAGGRLQRIERRVGGINLADDPGEPGGDLHQLGLNPHDLLVQPGLGIPHVVPAAAQGGLPLPDQIALVADPAGLFLDRTQARVMGGERIAREGYPFLCLMSLRCHPLERVTNGSEGVFIAAHHRLSLSQSIDRRVQQPR